MPKWKSKFPDGPVPKRFREEQWRTKFIRPKPDLTNAQIEYTKQMYREEVRRLENERSKLDQLEYLRKAIGSGGISIEEAAKIFTQSVSAIGQGIQQGFEWKILDFGPQQWGEVSSSDVTLEQAPMSPIPAPTTKTKEELVELEDLGIDWSKTSQRDCDPVDSTRAPVKRESLAGVPRLKCSVRSINVSSDTYDVTSYDGVNKTWTRGIAKLNIELECNPTAEDMRMIEDMVKPFNTGPYLIAYVTREDWDV